jgi:glyoxylase-like metal-dependent hydrolase (beta-lactamase superfamily II)
MPAVQHRTRIGAVTLVPAQTGARLSANSLFLEGPGLLVDTGADEAALRALAPRVRRVLYTHYHGDHRWHAGLFGHAETFAHALDAPPLERFEALVGTVVAPGAPVRAAFEAWFQGHVAPVRVDVRLTSEAALGIDGARIVPLHMPGHTPGMLCPYFPDERLLFLTDYDLTRFGPWYGNTGSSLDAFEQSLDRIAGFEADWFMTSHLPGALTRDEMRALLGEYRAIIARRDERLLELLAAPKTLAELAQVGICYKLAHLARDAHLTWFEMLQIGHHLERLARRGLVVQHGDHFVRS